MKSQISISEAASRFKVGRATIKRKVKSGQAKTLDVTELVRVFGEPPSSTEQAPKAGLMQPGLTSLSHEVDLLKKDIQHQKELLTIKDEQIEDLRSQVRRLQPIPLLEQLKNVWKK